MNNESFWSYRINWLVAGLPLAAVIAGTATLFIALAHPDPVMKSKPAQPAERPAQEARNHAATGGALPANR